MSSFKGKNKEESREKKTSSIIVIFRYGDWIDLVLVVLGTIGAIGDGMSTSWYLLIYSRYANKLGFGKTHQNQDTFMADIVRTIMPFLYLGLALMVAGIMEGYCWSWTSQRQVMRIRLKYLESILRQEVGFFDSQQATTSEIIESISRDTALIQEVLSEKVPLFLMNTSKFVSGLAFLMYFSLRLFLVAFPLVTLLIVPGIIYGKYNHHLWKKASTEYNQANTIVEQALSSIKTVYSFTAEKTIVEKYSAILKRISKIGVKQGLAKGLAVGSTGIIFLIWAFLDWYGSRLVMYHGETGGRVYAAALSFVVGGRSIGVALPDVNYFTEASVAVVRIFERIDRVPIIDGEDKRGIILDQIRGELDFEHVEFTYPSRPESIVLKNFNLKVPAGETVALVGASGCGKSTAISLLQRFYDSDNGVVRIDGVDIKTLQLKWVREKMGLVSQEHALFGTSIKENILFGKPDATMEEIISATMAANAHNFITQLPEGYDTNVGERGALLSGGQKQRIAIARAIIKNPAILLLDEATSALDSESEVLVQTALDQVSMGRTTLVIAHKLATVKNAHQIAVVSGGSIVEIGSHNDLITRSNGHYSKLANLQNQTSNNDQEQITEVRISSITGSNSNYLINSSKSSPDTSFALSSPIEKAGIIKSTSPPSFIRLLSLSIPEWKQGLAGAFSAITFGAIQPIAAITIGGMVAGFFAQNHDVIRASIRSSTLIFSSLSLLSILVSLSQHLNFAYVGEHLTRRIRLRMLEKILTFELAWFNQDQNSSAALASRLSNEASIVKSLVADRVSLLLYTASAVIVATLMSLITAWKLALVVIFIQPLTILCIYTRKKLLSSVTYNILKAQNSSTQIAVEAVYNHRIVTSFGSMGKILQLFQEAQEEPRKEVIKNSWFAGLGMGFTECFSFISCVLQFWYGGKLVDLGQISPGDVFKIFIMWNNTSRIISDAGSMTSDLAKGTIAVASVFEVLNRESLIPVSYQEADEKKGKKLTRISGEIDMDKVDFAYPNRLEYPVLRQFCLKVNAGTSIGLVGKSGCGKSTVIGLILRFYDIQRGIVKVDGVDLRELDLGWYRGHTALVSQEPVLYSGTIRDNIIFGKPDASEVEVIEAAKAANAHGFISTLNEGYETQCGERGVQLSGGQKQRIAIARAIIRNPTILLLDEATSALDVQSEQVVQEALNQIMIGRTTIVVAHRLTTIEKLDSVAVVADGRLVERGTYQELQSKRGPFFELASIHT